MPVEIMPAYTAIKADQSRAADQGFRTMGTVICDACGERFLIDHPVRFADKHLAAKQAEWLEKVLAYDHECQRGHPDRVALP
jgi:rRNA maturation protein Nop10